MCTPERRISNNRPSHLRTSLCPDLPDFPAFTISERMFLRISSFKPGYGKTKKVPFVGDNKCFSHFLLGPLLLLSLFFLSREPVAPISAFGADGSM